MLSLMSLRVWRKLSLGLSANVESVCRKHSQLLGIPPLQRQRLLRLAKCVFLVQLYIITLPSRLSVFNNPTFYSSVYDKHAELWGMGWSNGR